MVKEAFFELFDSDSKYKSVTVAGSFNDWNPTSDFLSFVPNLKTWQLKLTLNETSPDKLFYKYVVDGSNWICNDAQPIEDDDQHNQNNYIMITNKSTDYTDEDKLSETENVESLDTANTSIIPNIITKDIDNEDELFDTTIRSPGTPSSEEETFSQNNIDTYEKDKQPKPEASPFNIQSIWNSIKWFFGYYIFSIFYNPKSN